MQNISVASAFWIGNSNDKIGFVGYEEEPRRLGIIYCPIRPSTIYTVDLKDPLAIPKPLFSPDTKEESIRSPRVSPNGKELVYLVSPAGGPHFQSSKLVHYNFEKNEKKVVVDNTGKKKIVDGRYGDIAVLFSRNSLPKNCWTINQNFIILSTLTETRQVVCAVNIKTGEINELNFPTDSCTVITVKQDIILASGSGINMKPNIFVGYFDQNNLNNIQWHTIDKEMTEVADDITYHTDYLPTKDDVSKLLTTILVGPASTSLTAPLPTIVLCHGGPHSSCASEYSNTIVMLAKLGFRILLSMFIN